MSISELLSFFIFISMLSTSSLGKKKVRCEEKQWPCLHSESCLSESFLCDDYPDCPDASDESKKICSTNKYGECRYDFLYKCLDKQKCISKRHLCDGEEHCSDGSDEAEDMCDITKKPEVPYDCSDARVDIWSKALIDAVGCYDYWWFPYVVYYVRWTGYMQIFASVLVIIMFSLIRSRIL